VAYIAHSQQQKASGKQLESSPCYAKVFIGADEQPLCDEAVSVDPDRPSFERFSPSLPL
jgi:hypothetical protein